MFLVLPKARIINPTAPFRAVETCATGAALCYKKSLDDLDADEVSAFIKRRIDIGHETVIEHASFSALLLTNRGVTHELVRHRICAFTQESTRFTNYEKKDGGVTFIIPPKLREDVRPGEWTMDTAENFRMEDGIDDEVADWVMDMALAEHSYMRALSRGWAPEEARCYLNNATATQILMTANMREWRHVFNLRVKGTTGRPHPEIKEVLLPVYEEAKALYPVFFD
jgi:thymidylate synthase (FAD)